jgi:N-acetylmuramoyl-L-alanine amidase
MRRIDEIIVHCSATAEGRAFTTDDIRQWHTSPPRNWRDIGYHYVIEIDGSIHKGRPIVQQGAHCSEGGHNRHSIGVCYVGGCAKNGKTPKDTRTPEQKNALVQLLTELHSQFPMARLYGHRELVCSLKKKHPQHNCQLCKHYPELCLYAKKSCPSFDVHEYDYIFE